MIYERVPGLGWRNILPRADGTLDHSIHYPEGDTMSRTTDDEYTIRHALDMGLQAWRPTQGATKFREAHDALSALLDKLLQAYRARDEARGQISELAKVVQEFIDQRLATEGVLSADGVGDLMDALDKLRRAVTSNSGASA